MDPDARIANVTLRFYARKDVISASSSVVTTLWSAGKRVVAENTAARVKVLRVDGNSFAARKARLELRDWVPADVLPRSLGGLGSFPCGQQGWAGQGGVPSPGSPNPFFMSFQTFCGPNEPRAV